jgi:hypothetical protein
MSNANTHAQLTSDGVKDNVVESKSVVVVVEEENEIWCCVCCLRTGLFVDGVGDHRLLPSGSILEENTTIG